MHYKPERQVEDMGCCIGSSHSFCVYCSEKVVCSGRLKRATSLHSDQPPPLGIFADSLWEQLPVLC